MPSYEKSSSERAGLQPDHERVTWYRNFEGMYHRAGKEWVKSGLAVCGADIGRPAFTAWEGDKESMKWMARRGQCQACKGEE